MSHINQYRLKPLAFAIAYLFLMPMAFGEEVEKNAQLPTDTVQLEDVLVVGNKEVARDAIGHSKVYNGKLSTVYRGKEEVERFKGSAPADVFKGMVGVNSGDARNSGALDPNVRGVQGQGRVPLTIDGTEQSITVHRGYAGANNRNYIDPMLIGGITVEKGPSLSRGVNSSVGGAVAVTTLNIHDVVSEGQDWGVDIKVEGSNNSTKPKLHNLNQDSKELIKVTGANSAMLSFYDSATLVNPKDSGQNQFGNDQAFRIAAGKKWDHFDLLAAYVYRKKGNHFAGKNGAHRYSAGEYDKTSPEAVKNYWDNYTKHLAQVYKPGAEVTNTSNEMQSVLLKGTWRPTDNQSLQLGLRQTWGEYGEIMPSRVASHLGDYDIINHTGPQENIDYLQKNVIGKFPQWPLSKINMTAVNLNYKWNPDNPYIDLDTNLWMTNTKLDTHTSGGYPREFYSKIPGIPEDLVGKHRNTSLTNSKDKRWGLTTSNKMDLADNLSLTIGGSYQHETLRSNDNWYNDPVEQQVAQVFSFRSLPREGWRKEWDLNFNFDWQPTSWLEISAGARKNGYSSYDEQLNRQRKAKNEAYATQGAPGFVLDYVIKPTQELLDAKQKQLDAEKYVFANYKIGSNEYWDALDEIDAKYMSIENKFKQEHIKDKGLNATLQYREDGFNIRGNTRWYARDDGRFYREDNPFMNGELTAHNAGPIPGNTKSRTTNKLLTDAERFAEVPKQSNSGAWQPILSATASLTDNARIYARYAKTQRMPSIFESTVGFSASPMYLGVPLKPEKSTNIEIGYVHDLSELLNAERYADIKIAWFKNDIKNVIDRDRHFSMRNIDRQKISGIELQSRYDNGRFFADFSASYFLKNEVCDRSTAISMDPYFGSIPNCVKGGFDNGYLRNSVPPKYALNLTLGGRFMDEKLEIGTRILHHASSKDTDMKNFGNVETYVTNVPIHWGKVTTFDAWVNYALKKDLTVELVGSNLSNQYYLDPLTRTHFPAPGRTIRLGINKKF